MATVTCQRCGHAVQLHGLTGAIQCRNCGERHGVGSQTTSGNRTRIEVESNDDDVYGPEYAIQ